MEEPQEFETIITAFEAAEILKLNVHAVYRLLKSGELEGGKVGGRFRTTREAIQRMVLRPNNSPEVIPPESDSSRVSHLAGIAYLESL